MLQGEVGFGAGLSMTNQSFKGQWIFPDGSQDDPWVPKNTEDKPMFFDMNLGFYYSSENVYLSCSMRNLLQSQIKYTSTEAGGNVKSSYNARQLFVGAGYEYQLANPLFAFKPNLFIATDFASTSFSLTGIFTYNEKIFGGVAYKPIDAIVFLAGLSLPSGIEVAVSYDLTTSSIIKYSSGSLEVMLGYSFSLSRDKDNRKYKSVRFL
jgi:type IX secretion system PorP/SprF family membrane protein